MVPYGKKAIKRWRESLFHSFLVNATDAQSVRGLRQVVRNLLHPIRRVCVHRENSTHSFAMSFTHRLSHGLSRKGSIVAQRVVTTGTNAGGAIG
jgi:hypothetical protein